MTFFNKKEDIITVELTPYGRYLFGQGKLTPAYYEFHDDDILYDSEAGGFSEENNEVTKRIVSETPRLRPQRDIISVESNIFMNERNERESHPHTKTKANYLTEPIGTSDQTSDYAPSWKATMIQGHITGSVVTHLTGSKEYLRQIPQVNCEIEYKMRIRNTSEDSPVRGLQETPTLFVSEVYPDGTYVELIEEQVLCQLKELQGFIFKDGIEMQAFLYDDTEEENLIPLKLLPESGLIVNDLLLDGPTLDPLDPTISSQYLEYYVDFLVDKEIPEEDICVGVSKLKAQDIQIGIEIECSDLESVDFDIYGSRVGESDVEICE